MKRHLRYLLCNGAPVADVNQRKDMLDTEEDGRMLDI